MANDEPDTTRTVSTRRDFLRNSAVVGGVAWAAPTVLSLGPNALATTGGSPRCYRFRYERSGTDPDSGLPTPARYECANTLSAAGCPLPEPDLDLWEAATCVDIVNVDDPGSTGDEPVASIPHGEGEGLIDVVEEDDGTLTITLPEGCAYTVVQAKAGGGPNTVDPCLEEVTDLTENSFNVKSLGVNPSGKPAAVSHVDVVFCCN